ncbi:MAG: hypothetical protein AB1482_08690 [Pseudomonadota bacterium]
MKPLASSALRDSFLRFGERGLQAAALALLALLLVKAAVDISHHFDSWWYHLPWAARLVGLVGADAYLFEPIAAARYDGFPLLPELLQGLAWRLTGRVESANLINFVALVAFIAFLRHFFRVSWWLAVPALLAVPLVQAHATSTYVDLIANLAMAAMVLLAYLFYAKPDTVRPAPLVVLGLCAFIAAHSKFQLIPLVAIASAFAAIPILRQMLARPATDGMARRPALALIVFALALSAVFWVPLKNLYLHGNPVYPIQISVLGHKLNGPEMLPPEDLGGGAIESSNRVTKWFYSVTEIGMGDIRNVKRWTLDSAAPEGSPLGIQGGLFGAYVILNLLVFAWLAARIPRRERFVAVAFVGLVTVLAAVMPASHLLRYYMFWFIALISLNLYLLTQQHATAPNLVAGGICMVFVLIVIDATDQNFVRPQFRSTSDLLAERVDQRILAQLRDAEPVCLALDAASQPFLYASIWHPGTNYSIKAGPFKPVYSNEVVQTCENRRVVFTPRQ